MSQSSKTLVGRGRELHELESGLDEAVGGVGGLFVLVGEPGVGKTRLADEVARRARGLGFTVHWGRCWEAGGAPAFWPWIQIFRSMLRDPRCKPIATAYGDVLSRLLPELRTDSREVARELDQGQARFQLFDEAWALLRAMAEQAPLCVVLDDLHAADPSSLALLQFIVRDLRANRVVALATYRDREANPAADVSEAIRSIAREGTFLPLGRLTPDEVAKLLDDRAGKPVSRELAAALHKATEGNPMYVDQIYRTLEARGALDAPPAALPVPEGIREVIRARLGALVPATRTVIDAASVIGREFDRALLAAVSGRDEPSLRDPLKSALDAGIVVEPVIGAFEFSHALFREAVYRDLSAGERATYHARAAEALEASSAPDNGLGEIAQHLLAAANVVGPERAAEGSMRAGRRALSALAFEDAVTILSATLGELGSALRDQRVRGRVLVMLGEARARVGDYEGARKVCEEAAAIARNLGEPTLLAEAGLALGVELLPGIVAATLVNLLQEARRSLPDDPTPLRARVLARLAAALQPATNPAEPIEIARQALAMARALGDEDTLRACLYMGGAALVDFADPAERCAWDGELLHASTRVDDVTAALRAHVRLFFDHLEIGQVIEADAHLEEHQRLADRLGLPTYQWLTLMMRSLRAIWEGRFADAVDFRDRARRVGQRIMTPEREMSMLLQGFGLAIARGEPLPDVQRVVTLSGHFPQSEFMAVVMRAFEEVRHGSSEAARELVARVSVENPMLACMGPHLRFLTEACTRLDDRARAARIRPCMEPFAGRMASQGRVGFFVEGPVSWLQGMLAGVAGEWDESTRLFEDALEQTSRMGMKPYEAITCLEYARMLARRGKAFDDRRAELLRRGSAIAKELGTTSLARSFDEAMGVLGTSQAPKGATAEARPVTDRPVEVSKFSMRREGEMWALESGRGTIRVKDSRGMQMLAELTLHPNREFHVLTLMGAELTDAGDAGEVIDREAARAYRARAEDLRDQLEEAESFGDPARAARARAELEIISEELAAGVGLGGRSRRAGAAAERARINVQRRLREAIRRIGEHDAPLGRHLDRAVRTGSFCAYETD